MAAPRPPMPGDSASGETMGLPVDRAGVEIPAGFPADSMATFNPSQTASFRDLGGAGFEGDENVTAGFFIPREDGSSDSAVRVISPPLTPPAPGDITFRLRRIIGRGGFGEIWEAEQSSLARLVAVKRLRPDIERRASESPDESEQLRASFRQEAFTAANLEHPNIVPIHDLGRDSDGRQVLAMKLVRGRPWDSILAEDFVAMGVEDFLAKHLSVLIGVGQAVAFSHSRGVAHRDLKPSQVMVGEFGEVLLMDWGLAVAFDRDRLESSRGGIAGSEFVCDLGNASSPAGTPAFMAPEQTERSAARIGPWTDVFLLGGTLYYLLTGTAPHQAPSAGASYFRAMTADIQPPGDRAPDRLVPQQLASLAMMSMSADPGDRVPSARAFVDELTDYLSGSSKRRESAGLVRDAAARLENAEGSYGELNEIMQALGNARALWVANPELPGLRERTLTAFARSALANGDLKLARVQADRIEVAARRAELLLEIDAREAQQARRERQRRLAVGGAGFLTLVLALLIAKHYADQMAANERLAAEVARAGAARADAEGLINFMLADLGESLRPIGRLDVLNSVGRQALTYYERLPASERSPQVDLRRARATYQVGEISFAQEGTAEAEARYREALRMAGDAVAALGETAAGELTVGLAEKGLADVARARGKLDEARPHFEAAAARTARAGELGAPAKDWVPVWTGALLELGRIRELKGDLAGAQQAYEEPAQIVAGALAAHPGDRVLSEVESTRLYFLGNIRNLRGESRAALEAFQELVANRERMLERDPKDTQMMRNLAITQNVLAQAEEAEGDAGSALENFQRCRDTFKRLAASDPTNSDWQLNLGVSHSSVGSMLLSAGKVDEAEAEFREFERVLLALVERDPQNAAFRSNLAVSRAYLAQVHEARREWDDVIRRQEEVRATLRPLLESGQRNVRWLREWAVATLRLAQAEARVARVAEAAAHFEESLRYRDELVEASPETLAFRRDRAVAQTFAANFHCMRGDPRLGADLAERARATFRDLAANAETREFAIDAAMCERLRRLCLERAAAPSSQDIDSDATIALLEGLSRESVKRESELAAELALQYIGRGDRLALAGDAEGARRDYEAAEGRTRDASMLETADACREARALALARLHRVSEAEPIIRGLLDEEYDNFGMMELRRVIEK